MGIHSSGIRRTLTHQRRAVAALFLALTLVGGATPSPAAAVSPTSSLVVDSMDDPAAGWFVDGGGGSIARSTSTVHAGAASMRVAYDFSSAGAISISPRSTPAELPGLPRTISLDVYGDGSYNTVYVELRDATGEIFRYWLGNPYLAGWHTLTAALGTGSPVSFRAGNADGLLDLPVSVFQILVWDSSATKSGTIYLDQLTYGYEAATVPVATPYAFAPSAGQATTLQMGLQEAGSATLRVLDEFGRELTWSGNIGSGATASRAWDGRDNLGTVMRGAVRGYLTVVRGPTTWRYVVPYLGGVLVRPPGPSSGPFSGVNAFLTQLDTNARGTVEAQARLEEDAYVHMAREEFDWVRLEARRGWFDWAKFDQAVEVDRAHGVDILGKLFYTAPWASSAPPGTPLQTARYYGPADMGAYYDFVRAVVHRYKNRIHFWEVWNEPNAVGLWLPSPNAAQYTAMLKVAYAAVKDEDASATVVLGGLSTGPDQSFLSGIQAAGGWSSFDVLAMHTYVSGEPRGSTFEVWLSLAHQIVNQYGQKPIWITEFGWSTYAGGVSQAQQALYLASAYSLAVASGVVGTIWFELRDASSGSGSDLGNYGVVTTGLAAKPAYAKLQCAGASLYAGLGGTCGGPVNGVSRLGGADRYATAAAVSAWTFATGPPIAFVATGANFPDALAGAAAAGVLGGPVLLVTRDTVPAATAAELARLRPARIVVLGSTGVVSDTVLDALHAYTDGPVGRLGGADRYATAAAVSAWTFATGPPIAFVATGANFPDALAGAAAAGVLGGPVLLVTRDTVPAATAAELARLRPARIVVLGSTGVVSDTVLDALHAYTDGPVGRLGGADRYATAAAVSAWTFATGPPIAFVATGANFPDALAGAAAAGVLGGPVLLVTRDTVPAATAAELARLRPARIVVLGSTGVVSDTVLDAVAASF